MVAFDDSFKPFADAGQLLAIQSLAGERPTRFFKVVGIEPVPTLLITIAASADNERQQTLEVGSGVLVQWRYRVVTAAAQPVLRSPQAARSYATGGGGSGFVADTTDTDWGTVNDRSLTEFFFLGGQNDEIRFDNLSATAATAARFSAFKHFLVGAEVTEWTMLNPQNTSELIDVDPHIVPDRQLHLLQNFAGIVPLFLTRG